MVIYDNLPIMTKHFAGSWAEIYLHSKLLYPTLIASWIADLKQSRKTSYVSRDPEKLALIYQTEGLNDEFLAKSAVYWIQNNKNKKVDFSAIMKNWFVFSGTGLATEVKSFLDFFKPEILNSEIWNRIFENDMGWMLFRILPPVSKKETALAVVKNIYQHAPRGLVRSFVAHDYLTFFLSFCMTYPDICPRCRREFQILNEEGELEKDVVALVEGPMLVESVQVPAFEVSFEDGHKEWQAGYCAAEKTYVDYVEKEYSEIIEENDGTKHRAIEKRESLHLFVDKIWGSVTQGQIDRIARMRNDGKLVVEYYDLSKLLEE